MMEYLKGLTFSATKVVLLSITAGLLYFTATGTIDGKDFMTIALMVFAFYFGQKVNLVK